MYHPIDQTDDMIQFEHGHSQINVNDSKLFRFFDLEHSLLFNFALKSCENPDDEQRLDSTHAHGSSHDDELYEPGQRVLFIQVRYIFLMVN